MNSIEWYKQKHGSQWLKKYNSDKRAANKSNIYTKYGEKRKAHWGEFDYYKDKCKQLTNQNVHLVEGSHKRSFNGMHVDHKISIKFGFDNGIPEEHIAHHSNLRMLNAKCNIRKHTLCVVDDDNRWLLTDNDVEFEGLV